MKQLCAWSCVVLAGAPALAHADYELVTTGPSQSQFLVDPNTIVRQEQFLKTWYLWSWPGKLEAMDPLLKRRVQYSSFLELDLYDCAHRTSRMSQIALYSEQMGKGKVVSLSSASPEDAQFKDSLPGSPGEALLNYVCAHAPPTVPAKK